MQFKSLIVLIASFILTAKSMDEAIHEQPEKQIRFERKSHCFKKTAGAVATVLCILPAVIFGCLDGAGQGVLIAATKTYDNFALARDGIYDSCCWNALCCPCSCGWITILGSIIGTEESPRQLLNHCIGVNCIEPKCTSQLKKKIYWDECWHH